MRSLRFNTPICAVVIACAGLGLAPIAHSQDALGDGNALGDGTALDNNLQVGSGGYNSPGRNWQSEIAYRNALVTGNVGGGKQFRGSIGYSGVNDFRGSLGSDLVYNFQRETYYSGLATRQIRGLEASTILMQGAVAGLRAGAGGLSGDLIIERPGAGAQAGSITHSSVTPQNQISDLVAFDRVNTTLRSTSAFTVRNATRPQIVGAASDGTNQYYLTASPLGGIDALNPLDPALVSRRSIDPNQFNLDPRIAIPGFKEQAIQDQQLLNELENAEAIAQRMPSHERILNDLREKAEQRGLIKPQQPRPNESEQETPLNPDTRQPGTPTNPTGIEFPSIEPATPDNPEPGATRTNDRNANPGRTSADELDRLLRGFSRDLEPNQYPLGPSGGGGPDNAPPDLGPTRLRRSKDLTDTEELGVDETAAQERMDRVIELLRGQTNTIEHIAPSSGGSLYAEHMRTGEHLLGEGMWFIAEERFVAALSAKPGDAMAAIGRVHAQIGAGLYLSAAVNLSDLLRAYPELSTVRYEESLLPGAERLERIRIQLRKRSVKDDPSARNAGFLLAYLGYQTARPNDVREGFAVIKRVNEALDTPTDPLVPVLMEIWSNPTPDENAPEPITPAP